MKKLLLDSTGRILDLVDTAEEVINGTQITKGAETLVYARGLVASVVDIDETTIPAKVELNRICDYDYIDGAFVRMRRPDISKFEYRQRFTVDEKDILDNWEEELAAQSVDEATKTWRRRKMRSIMNDFNSVNSVDLNHPGMLDYGRVLIACELMSVERVAEILMRDVSEFALPQ